MPLPVFPAKPADGATVNIAVVGVASQPVLVCPNATQDVQVRIYYPGTIQAFIKAGQDNSVAATVANDIPVVVGPSCEVLSFPAQPSGKLWIACIGAAASAGPIYFTPVVGN